MEGCGDEESLGRATSDDDDSIGVEDDSFDPEGFLASTAAAVAEITVEWSCCREAGVERPGLCAVRERDRKGSVPRHWLQRSDDDV